jgi:ParB family chromosome partitioning protein
MTKDRRLGRGLAALLGTPLGEVGEEAGGAPEGPFAGPPVASLPQAPAAKTAAQVPAGVAAATSDTDAEHGELLHLKVDEIQENPFQPRRDFSEPEIASLAESLKTHDLLQPVLVRRVDGKYQLISGERRLRAATLAGWKTIPARVREADDRLVAELAIVENLQRKDLNPVEKALSFKRYLDQHRCTQDELAQRLKLDRSTIANLVRLLELPQQALDAIRTGLVTAGHARALLPLGDARQQVAFCERIVREELSVRDVERLVSEQIASEDGDKPMVAGKIMPAGKKSRSEQVANLEQELRAALGTKVEIKTAAKGRGKITIQFGNHDDFERIFEQLVESSGRSSKIV